MTDRNFSGAVNPAQGLVACFSANSQFIHKSNTSRFAVGVGGDV